jgi:hypothetical protein
MAESFFKEQFGNIKKIKVCTTTADLNFDTYTEPGTYEIYEDMGSGQNRIYFLTVDKSVSGACIKQTRIHCGTVDARQTDTAGVWSDWVALPGGGSVDLSDYYTKTEIDNFRIEDEMNMERHVGLRLDESLGDISAALDELHAYAMALSGGAK